MIAFLHTSSIHIKRFEDLVKKHNNTIVVKHFINKDLLKTATSTGALDVKNFQIQIEEIKKDPIQIIICTCTTYGKVCEGIEDVVRIDQPLIEYLVSKYSTIGMAFSVASTRKVSKALIEKIALIMERKIDIVELNCTSSWKYFEAGNFEIYEKSIAEQIRQKSKNVEVVFLAQASMEGAIKHLKKLEKEIYSIPEFGVKSFLEKIKKID